MLDRGGKDSQRLGPVSLQKKSHNSKLSAVRRERWGKAYHTFPSAPFVASTYVSIKATCPSTCRFKGNGCYVEAGSAVGPMRRLDAAAVGMTGTPVNALESELIDEQWWGKKVPQDGPNGLGRPIRLHVGGETAGPMGAGFLGGAIDRWLGRGGGPGWTFTHNWRKIRREKFGPISALASVETVRDAEEAIELGYSPAITAVSFREDRMHKLRKSKVRVIPCPAQTRGRTCASCGLCLKPLPEGVAIGFAVHGKLQSVAAKRLKVLR